MIGIHSHNCRLGHARRFGETFGTISHEKSTALARAGITLITQQSIGMLNGDDAIAGLVGHSPLRWQARTERITARDNRGAQALEKFKILLHLVLLFYSNLAI